MLFTITIVIVVAWIAIRAVIKADRTEDDRLHRQRENKEAQRILEARRRQAATRPEPPKYERYVFKVAGTSFRKDALLSFARENDGYGANKRQRASEDGCYADREYEYNFSVSKAELVPEPENKHDPNAIRVEFDGKHVGYIHAEDCGLVRSLMESGRIHNIAPKIGGGKYKELRLSDDVWDEEEARLSDYYFECGDIPYYAEILVIAKPEEKTEQEQPQSEDWTTCPHCGEKIRSGLKYCCMCGKKI